MPDTKLPGFTVGGDYDFPLNPPPTPNPPIVEYGWMGGMTGGEDQSPVNKGDNTYYYILLHQLFGWTIIDPAKDTVHISGGTLQGGLYAWTQNLGWLYMTPTQLNLNYASLPVDYNAGGWDFKKWIIPSNWTFTPPSTHRYAYSFDRNTTIAFGTFYDSGFYFYDYSMQMWIFATYGSESISTPTGFGEYAIEHNANLPTISYNPESTIERRLINLIGWVKHTGGEPGISFVSDGTNSAVYFGENATTGWNIPHKITSLNLPNLDNPVGQADFRFRDSYWDESTQSYVTGSKWDPDTGTWVWAGGNYIHSNLPNSALTSKLASNYILDVETKVLDDTANNEGTFVIYDRPALVDLISITADGSFDSKITDHFFVPNEDLYYGPTSHSSYSQYFFDRPGSQENRKSVDIFYWNLYGAKEFQLDPENNFAPISFRDIHPLHYYQYVWQTNGEPYTAPQYYQDYPGQGITGGSTTKGPFFASIPDTSEFLSVGIPNTGINNKYRNRWQLTGNDNSDTDIANDTHPWIRRYNAIYKAIYSSVAGGRVIATIHGENAPGYYVGGDLLTNPDREDYRMEGTVRPYNSPFADWYWDSFVFGDWSWLHYAPFVSVAYHSWMSPDHGLGTFTNIGPIVWPNSGYIEAPNKGFNRMIGNLTHPSIIEKDGYFYIFYIERTNYYDTSLDSGNSWASVKLARVTRQSYADQSQYKVYTGTGWARSLPSGFSNSTISNFYDVPALNKAINIVPYPNEPLHGNFRTNIWSVDVAKLQQTINGKQYYLMAEYSQVLNISKAPRVLLVLSFRLSEDLIHWTDAVPVLIHPDEFRNQYPRFLNAEGTRSDVIDINNFYTTGRLYHLYALINYTNLLEFED